MPEYKPSMGLENSIYPRIYKPENKLFLLLSYFAWILITIVVLQDILNNTEIYFTARRHVDFWGRWVGVLSLMFFVYYYVLLTFAYKITLNPDSIEINALLYKKILRRDEIQSYFYSYGGESYSCILLKINQSINLKKSKDSEVIIYLVFERDQAFNNWFSEVPCRGGSPLPKINEEFK